MQTSSLPQNQIFSVTQITEIIKEILEQSFRFITIEGEISNWRPSAAGHVYFTLKDNNSQLKAVMFRGNLNGLTFRPKDGDKVRCTGSITVYGPQGSYQLNVTKMEQAGVGNILQMLEERKRLFAAEGLFDEENKKTLPLFPKTIGVVTSPTGAAIRDILNVAKRRNKSINITVLPAVVQGDGAASTIVKMIEIANYYDLCDVLIVGRGGGSLEDLLPFSEEIVIRAIAASHIPVISAVGHEIDWALCDYVADKRAATPSAAAELVVPLYSDIKLELQNYQKTFYETITQKVEQKRLLIRSFNPESLELRFRSIQQPLLNRYENAKEGLIKNLQDKIKELRLNIENCKTILENASPETIFQRGYSMVRSKNTGLIVRNADSVKIGEELEITPAKGKIKAKVIE